MLDMVFQRVTHIYRNIIYLGRLHFGSSPYFCKDNSCPHWAMEGGTSALVLLNSWSVGIGGYTAGTVF